MLTECCIGCGKNMHHLAQVTWIALSGMSVNIYILLRIKPCQYLHEDDLGNFLPSSYTSAYLETTV